MPYVRLKKLWYVGSESMYSSRKLLRTPKSHFPKSKSDFVFGVSYGMKTSVFEQFNFRIEGTLRNQ